MNAWEILSDQLYYWSDQDAKTIGIIPAAATQGAAAQTARPSADPARFPHRALQALREAGLQVRPGARPRAQVLPLHQPDRPRTPNGLRAPRIPRPGTGIFGQLPSRAGDHRRDLADQSGTSTPQRGFVETRHGCQRYRAACRVCGHPADLRFGSEHAHRAAPRRLGIQADTGGQP